MIALAWHTVRARKASLVGTFIALCLGVTLLGAMAVTLASTIGRDRPVRWYTTADVVVAGANGITVHFGSGEDAETYTTSTVESRPLPADLVSRLSTVDASVVVDYAGPATAPGVPGDTAHPWSAASLHAYRWVAGRAPMNAGEVVLTGPTDHRPGDRLTVQTAAGPRPVTVSGVLSTAALPALYVTDQLAAELAGGRVAAVALTAPGAPTSRGGADLADRVRAVVGSEPARVLTGSHRHDAEPAPDDDQLVGAISLLGSTAGVAGFVSVFVVAGTFGYAVAARRREFGLLRTAGATPRQVRRLVLGEAVVVGALAAATGGALATPLAKWFVGWLTRHDITPDTFTAHFVFWAVAAAFGAGMLVAVAGAWLAARRASRVRPVEALRDAAVDRRAMTAGRWVVGLLSFAGSVPLLLLITHVHSADIVVLFLPITMLLVTGFGMFAPVLVPPLTWLLTAPLAPFVGSTGLLARYSALTAVRRTAATAAPVLVTVGFATASLTGINSLLHTEQAAERARVAAPAMITTAAGSGGLADSTIDALRRTPGVLAAVPTTDTTLYMPQGDDAPEPWTARYAPGRDFGGVLRLPVVAGDLADLTGTDTVALPAGRWHVGDRVHLWLADSTEVDLRLVAVLAKQIDTEETALLPAELRAAHTAHPTATTVYLRLAPQASLARIGSVAAAGGGQLTQTRDFLSAQAAEQARMNRNALLAVLGMALLYTTIAIANTLVMATGDRAGEFAALRLTGATRRQVLRAVGVEAALVAGIGILLAGAVTLAVVIGVRHSLPNSSPVVVVSIPWAIGSAIAATCLAVALLGSLLPALSLLRRRPVELAGVHE
jgi:putative ABC transport system permease protein